MAENGLKSSTFRAEREKTWLEFDQLLVKGGKDGLSSLTSKELLRLPGLYRATLSSISVARSISLDLSLVTYLENLSTRGYLQIYGVKATVRGTVSKFIFETFPQAVQKAKWHVLISLICMVMGTITGYTLTSANQDWYYTFVGTDDTRSPASSTEELRAVIYDEVKPSEDNLSIFATFLFTHNSRVGILAFALGFALGLPTIYLLFKNGLMLGAFTALHASRGLGPDIWGWLLIHGVTELLAIVLCGAAGLILGSAIIFPGKYGRLENHAREGKRAGVIVMGCVCMFLIAGLLEGFGRQLITDMGARYLVAVITGVIWVTYFVFLGRGKV